MRGLLGLILEGREVCGALQLPVPGSDFPKVLRAPCNFVL